VAPRPGIVIFVALWNFVWAFLEAVAGLMAVLGLVFGNFLAMSEEVARRWASAYPGEAGMLLFNFAAFFAAVLFLGLAIGTVFLGIGVLRGRSWAWYTQVVVSIFGLLAPPVGTAVSILVLILFFQKPVRDFFRIV
jgi:hypothetical protein